MFKNKTSGITLIALVITIIVLLLLAGVAINMVLGDEGIFKMTEAAIFKNDIRAYQEILDNKNLEIQTKYKAKQIEELTFLNATDYDDIREILPDFKMEYKDVIIIKDGNIALGSRLTKNDGLSEEELNMKKWLSDIEIEEEKVPVARDYLEIGHYVDYKPYADPQTDLPIDLDRNPNIKWVVLKNDGNEIMLISENPIDSITFGGADDWLTGPSNLDDTYAGLYSGDLGTARNLKIEDINEIMGFQEGDDIIKGHYYSKLTNKYTLVPDEITNIKGLEELEEVTISNRIGPDGKDVGEYKSDFYIYNKTAAKETANSDAVNLIFKTTDYWISSKGVNAYFAYSVNNAMFVIYDVRETKTNANTLFYGGTASSTTKAARPVIILNPNAEIANAETGTGESDNAWKLK